MENLNFDDNPIELTELKQMQLERLQVILNRAARNVTYYHDLFRSIGFLPEDLRSLEDLSKLPITSRQTLLERQPYGMLASPPRDVVRLHTALGPGGQQIVVPFTASDIRHWTQLTARSLKQALVTRDDAVQICLDYGKAVAAFGMHFGAEALGATVIPSSNLLMTDQLFVMKHYRATCLVCTPSYAHELGHFVEEQSFDPKTLFLRSVILVGEPWDEAIKREVMQRLLVKVSGAYGLDEVFNPGIGFENGQDGCLLVNEDQFLLEVVDPRDSRVLGEGQQGELLVTTLTKEALPLIRYRTGELASLRRCITDNNRDRLVLKLTGKRRDDLTYFNGAKFYPPQLGEVLRAVIGKDIPFSIVLSRSEKGDRAEMWVEMCELAFDHEMVGIAHIKDRLESNLFLRLGVTVHVRWMERGALEGVPSIQDNRGAFAIPQ